jgi:hypothetical protein
MKNTKEDYHDKLDKLHERLERRRLDGVKPTKAQIKAMVRRTYKITPMVSKLLILIIL